MNNPGYVSQNCEKNVDEKIGIATSLKEHTQRREDDGKDDLDDVRSCEWHFECVVFDELLR